MTNQVLCLRNIDLYAGICGKKLTQISNSSEEKEKKGAIFYSPENPAAHIYVLKQGEVELYKRENGKKIVLETLFPGDVFGNFGIPGSDHFAEAVRQCSICKTPTNEFVNVIQHHPDIAFGLMKALAEKTAEYENRISVLSQPAKQQIIYELRKLKRKNEQKILGKIFKIPLRISHQRIADKTGLNRVTVTKLMKELRESGMIHINEKTNEIVIEE